MDQVGFTIGVASELSGMTARQIRLLGEAGVVRPSLRTPKGRGDSARFSFFDVLRLRVITRLRASGDVPAERLRLAMGELAKVRDGGWEGKLLHTSDWESFALVDDPGRLAAGLGSSALTVVVSLSAVDAELGVELRRLGLSSPQAAAA
jgi:hypothetical protein